MSYLEIQNQIEVEERDEKPERINWHRITFWSSLGVAIVYLGLSRVREDHRIITIFEAEGRHILKNHIRYGYPEFAKWIGMGVH